MQVLHKDFLDGKVEIPLVSPDLLETELRSTLLDLRSGERVTFYITEQDGHN